YGPNTPRLPVRFRPGSRLRIVGVQPHEDTRGVGDVTAASHAGQGEGLDHKAAAVITHAVDGLLEGVDPDDGYGPGLPVAGRHQAGVHARTVAVGGAQVVRGGKCLHLPVEHGRHECPGRLQVGAVDLDVRYRLGHMYS